MRVAWNLTTGCLPVDSATARLLRQLVWTAVDGCQTWRGDPPRPDFAPRIYTSRDEVQLLSGPHSDVDRSVSWSRQTPPLPPFNWRRVPMWISAGRNTRYFPSLRLRNGMSAISSTWSSKNAVSCYEWTGSRQTTQHAGTWYRVAGGSRAVWRAGSSCAVVGWTEREGESAKKALGPVRRQTSLPTAVRQRSPQCHDGRQHRSEAASTASRWRHSTETSSTTSHKVRNARAVNNTSQRRYLITVYNLIHSTREVVKNRFSCQQIIIIIIYYYNSL